MSDGRTSPWVYVGWGCAVVALLIVLAIGGMAWWGYRLAKGIERDFKDPAARQAKTRAVVPYETLPAGYHPLGGFSVPFLMDMAMFTDRPPDAIDQGEEFDKSGFFFISSTRAASSSSPSAVSIPRTRRSSAASCAARGRSQRR
jgi:hypothetical protein